MPERKSVTINIVIVYILGSCHITMRNIINSQPSQHYTMSATDCTNRRFTSPIQRPGTEHCWCSAISCHLFLCLFSNKSIFEQITVSSSGNFFHTSSFYNAFFLSFLFYSIETSPQILPSFTYLAHHVLVSQPPHAQILYGSLKQDYNWTMMPKIK